MLYRIRNPAIVSILSDYFRSATVSSSGQAYRQLGKSGQLETNTELIAREGAETLRQEPKEKKRKKKKKKETRETRGKKERKRKKKKKKKQGGGSAEEEQLSHTLTSEPERVLFSEENSPRPQTDELRVSSVENI